MSILKKRLTRPYAFAFYVGIAVVLLIADRITKILAVEHLSDGTSVTFIPYVLDFCLTFNRGAAFGIFQGGRVFFVILALAVCIGVFIYLLMHKSHSLVEVLAISMIAAGAVGNGIDRFRAGEVVDFIRPVFIDFPIFNIADSCITVGVIIFILYLFFVSFRKTPAQADETEDSDAVEDSDVAEDSVAVDDDAAEAETSDAAEDSVAAIPADEAAVAQGEDSDTVEISAYIDIEANDAVDADDIEDPPDA